MVYGSRPFCSRGATILGDVYVYDLDCATSTIWVMYHSSRGHAHFFEVAQKIGGFGSDRATVQFDGIELTPYVHGANRKQGTAQMLPNE